jgi:hypothetical protein
MNLTLKRNAFKSAGIFGTLTDESGTQVAVTLEHAYEQTDGTYAPKLPRGVYTCQRGEHQLLGMSVPFTTFEITNVPGHTNILLHKGNFNRDSEGCVLVGTEANDTMILNSGVAFDKLMALQAGIYNFQLTVED